MSKVETLPPHDLDTPDVLVARFNNNNISDAVPFGVSKHSPISSAPAYALRCVFTIRECLTSFFRFCSIFQLCSAWRKWFAVVSIRLRDISDTHCGIGAQVSGDVGFSNSFSS